MFSKLICLLILFSQLWVLVSSYTPPQQPLQVQKQVIHFEAATIQLPIDHYNPDDDRTYANRYWYNATFHRPGGPIFFYDAGERGVSEGNLVGLSSPSHPVMNLTETFHGLAIVWEHRFYGNSSPFALDPRSTNSEKEAAYQYLNTEQALEDTVYFATHFEHLTSTGADASLKPDKTPWIWIGGSYPGQRAAMIRRRNPDIFFASYSSSATLEVRTSLPEYYLHISHDLPETCRNIVHEAVRSLDKILKDGSWLAKTKLRHAISTRWPKDTTSKWQRAQYTLAAPDIIVASHFTALVAADWQWRGMDGRMGVTCASISSADVSSNSTSQAGAMEVILDAIEANNRHFAERRGGASGLSQLDNQAWQYQVCTEYFAFRTGAPENPHNIISTLFTTQAIWDDTCKRQYPWLDQPSDQDVHARSLYAGWDKNVSNVMFITGLRDPWHEVSVAPSNGLIPEAPQNRTITKEIPACNELMTGNEVFGLLLSEGRHCSDLIAGSDDALKATELFKKALEVWLPCF